MCHRCQSLRVLDGRSRGLAPVTYVRLDQDYRKFGVLVFCSQGFRVRSCARFGFFGACWIFGACVPCRLWGVSERRLYADEAGVEGAGQDGVGGALNDGSAVGEEAKGVGSAAKSQEEAIGAEVGDLGEGGEAAVHRGEIERAVVLVDLDGVAAAEGDVRAASAVEMLELSVGADGALRIGRAGRDFGPGEGGGVEVWPEVEREEAAAHPVRLAGKELEGFGDLDGGGEVDGGGEDAGGVAGFDGSRGRNREDAGEAGGGGEIWAKVFARVADKRGEVGFMGFWRPV